jgi:hypothetical protein
MANNSKSQPQVVAPQESTYKRIKKDIIASATKGPVRKFVDENLLKTRQHRGGVR